MESEQDHKYKHKHKKVALHDNLVKLVEAKTKLCRYQHMSKREIANDMDLILEFMAAETLPFMQTVNPGLFCTRYLYPYKMFEGLKFDMDKYYGEEKVKVEKEKNNFMKKNYNPIIISSEEDEHVSLIYLGKQKKLN